MNTPGQEKPSISSLLCANACGFYGSPTTRNLCSKCYRNALLLEQQQEQQSSSQFTEKIVPSETRSLLKEASLNDEQLVAEKNKELLKLPDTLPSLPSGENSLLQKSIETSQTCCNEDHTSYCTATAFNKNPIVTGVACSSTQNIDNSYSDNSTSLVNDTYQKKDHASSQFLSYLPSPVSPRSSSAQSIIQDNNVSEPKATTTTLQQPNQVNKTRCFKCNKRVGLLGFQCRCNYYFCGTHRHADCHDCSFDYKTFGRQQLSKANQKIVADKLNRI